MHLLRTLAALLITALAAGGTAAQAPALVTVVSLDGATKLVLEPDHIAFVFTEAGARAIEERLSGSEPAAGRDRWTERFAYAGASGGIRGMRMRFDLDRVREVTVLDDAITLYIEGRAPDAAAADDRGRFVFEKPSPAEAAAFVEAFRRAKAGR